MEEKIRVLLADDDEISREGLKGVLGRIKDIEIVGEADTAPQAVQKVIETYPDVVIMDLSWFGDETAGIEATATIKRVAPKTRVIAITAYPKLIPPVRTNGADAALVRGFKAAELVQHIKAVYPLRKLLKGLEELTPSEESVARLLALGKSNQEIADSLVLSINTVKNHHVPNILAKTGCRDRVEFIARYAAVFREGAKGELMEAHTRD